MRRAGLLALALVTGCGDAADEAPMPDVSVSEDVVPPPPIVIPPLPYPASLVGEYRVAGIDGEALDAPFGIALSITEGRVAFEPACAAFVWYYAYRDGTLDIARRQEKLHHPPPPVCDEPVAPERERLATALDAVDRAGITPANGLELSGNGHSVLLFTQ